MPRYRQKTRNYKAIGLMCFLRWKILAGLETTEVWLRLKIIAILVKASFKP